MSYSSPRDHLSPPLSSPLGRHPVGSASTDGLSREISNLDIDSRSFTSARSSKLSLKKRFMRFLKRDPKVKETIVSSAAMLQSATQLHSTNTLNPELNMTLDSLDPFSQVQLNGVAIDIQAPIHIAVASTGIPVMQLHSSSTTTGSLRSDIFPENVSKLTLATDLPKYRARIEKTSQLATACSPRTHRDHN